LKNGHDDFISWGDFLGNKNFATKYKVFLPYDQAVAFVHKLGIKTYDEWIEYAHDSCPKFLPFAPWNVYQEYCGIRQWLGTDVVQLIKTRQEGHSVLCILHDQYDSPNIFSYQIFEGGMADAYLSCKDKYRIVRTYSFHPDHMETFRHIVWSNSSSFADRSFVTVNYYQLQFDLDMEFDIIRPGSIPSIL
jgi:hypothetical protein